MLIEVAEQMERLNADIGALDPALEQTPEVFHCVGVDVSVHVFDRVINDGVLIIGVEPFVGFQFIAEDCRPAST